MNGTGKEPTLSVVMPVYNGEPYLREAVESILKQTFTDFEFIIIDDGSTDRTWQILSEYAAQDERIILRRNPENLRLIKTLNKGLALARGKYIARQDADDISLPKRLATQVSYLQHHPEVGLLGTAYYRLYDQGQLSLRQPPLTDTEIRWKLLFGNIWCHPSMMFRRQVLENDEPFDEQYPHVEDYELWIRLLKHTCAATLPDPLVIYRVHEGSICFTHHEEQAHRVMAISSQQINALFPQRALTSSEIEALHRCYRSEQLTKQDMIIGGRAMFQLFNRFEQQSSVEASLMRSIRRRWIKNILISISIGQWRDLWKSGLFLSLFRHDPLAVVSALFIHLPKQTMLTRYAKRKT
jgi:glycosyltransferase involved in cell wall biosynthesis